MVLMVSALMGSVFVTPVTRARTVRSTINVLVFHVSMDPATRGDAFATMATQDTLALTAVLR